MNEPEQPQQSPRKNTNTNPNKTPSQETLTLIESVLDYIRSNLVNIKRTWGQDSIQYQQAASIMDQHLNANLKRLEVERTDIATLLGGLVLDDHHGGDDKSKG